MGAFFLADTDSITGRLRLAEMHRLETIGLRVLLRNESDDCLHSASPRGFFVLFCFSDKGVSLYRGDAWTKAVTTEQEKLLVSRWIEGYLNSDEDAMARFGAVRVATLVARDILNAPVNEPLTPMLPPEKADQRVSRPSLEHRRGLFVAFMVFVVVFSLSAIRKRDGV